MNGSFTGAIGSNGQGHEEREQDAVGEQPQRLPEGRGPRDGNPGPQENHKGNSHSV